MVRDSETNLIPESVALYEAYQKALKKGLLACGIGRGAIRAMESKSRIPALEMVCDFPEQALPLPDSLQRLLQQVYPPAPVFVNRIRIIEPYIEMTLRLTDGLKSSSGKLIIPPDGENPQIEVGQHIALRHGKCSYHKFAEGKFRMADGGTADRVAVEEIGLTPETMRDIVKLPQLVARHKMGYAASIYTEKLVFTRDLFMMASMGQCPFKKQRGR